MSILRKIKQRTQRRAHRTGSRLTGKHPRVSVFRSLNHIYAQIVNDAQHHTMVSMSSHELESATGDKKAVAHMVGVELATKAKALGITQVEFDRGSFLYHGRVKSLAEGLRAGGLTL